jgi:hypothetical protein
MNDLNNHQGEIEPGLLRKIEMLRPTPERDPEAAARGRQAFISELSSAPNLNDPPTVPTITGLFKRRSNHSESKNAMKTRTHRFAFTSAAAIITILVLLFGGAGVTAFAAQSALPGDALYSVKTGIEQTRVILARDAYAQAQLYLSFAERRMGEIAALIGQGRYSDVELASREFEDYVRKAIAALETVVAGDPERGSLLSSQITHTLLSYGAILRQVLFVVPDTVRPAVEQAILTSHDGAGDEVEIMGMVEAITETSITVSGQTIAIIDATEIEEGISVGVEVKVEAVIGSDGLLTAWEIESSGTGIGDDNDNADDNANDNDDGNANEDDDEDANDNEDANENEDDNANDNDDEDANDNDDDNANENEDNGNDDDDDNGNDNDADNGNDNDADNGNDNDDDNGNGNDNDDDSNDNDDGGSDDDEDGDSGNDDNSNDNGGGEDDGEFDD